MPSGIFKNTICFLHIYKVFFSTEYCGKTAYEFAKFFILMRKILYLTFITKEEHSIQKLNHV